jgi:ABC-type nitrate/sulfonate/bicarbonate transport system permease component
MGFTVGFAMGFTVGFTMGFTVGFTAFSTVRDKRIIDYWCWSYRTAWRLLLAPILTVLIQSIPKACEAFTLIFLEHTRY